MNNQVKNKSLNLNIAFEVIKKYIIIEKNHLIKLLKSYMSIPTIYRIINKLQKEKLIISVIIDNIPYIILSNNNNSNYLALFKCKNCGCVCFIDFDKNFSDDLYTRIKDNYLFHTEYTLFIFYGLCSECKVESISKGTI